MNEIYFAWYAVQLWRGYGPWGKAAAITSKPRLAAIIVEGLAMLASSGWVLYDTWATVLRKFSSPLAGIGFVVLPIFTAFTMMISYLLAEFIGSIVAGWSGSDS